MLQRRVGRNHVALACALLLAAYWLTAATVIATDPFDVYPWGPVPITDTDDVTDDNKQAVTATLKDRRVDLVMVGASTAIAYSPDDLRRAFPDARHPVNLSYGGVRPADRKAVLDQVIRHSRAGRVMIWLDWSYTLPPDERVGAFPAYLYDDTVLNDLQMVNLNAITIAANRWRGRPMFPHFRRDLDLIERSYTAEYRAFHAPATMTALAGFTTRFRADVLRSSDRRCADLAALRSQLLPQLRTLVRQGRRVDIVIPPYSPGFYYVQASSGSAGQFAEQKLLRRCLVDATARLPRLSIYALDADRGLAGALANYKDTSHLFGRAALDRAIGGIGNPALRLTRSNLGRYLVGLQRDVATFRTARQSQ